MGASLPQPIVCYLLGGSRTAPTTQRDCSRKTARAGILQGPSTMLRQVQGQVQHAKDGEAGRHWLSLSQSSLRPNRIHLSIFTFEYFNAVRYQVPMIFNIVLSQGLTIPLVVASMQYEQYLAEVFGSQVEIVHRLIPDGYLGTGDMSTLCPSVPLAFDQNRWLYRPQIKLLILTPRQPYGYYKSSLEDSLLLPKVFLRL